MKPNFALNLSHEGIGLLHRTPGGWHLVGEAQLDDGNLAETLSYLRQTAVELEGGAIATKLILPNSQILYDEIDAAGPDEDAREDQVRDALIGRTPYAVDDLRFDWRARGSRTQIAAVARETLEEAEAFAKEHRFNPVSFVAIPDAGQFDVEPFFGTTEGAGTLLDPGETVERDAFAIKIVPLPEATTPPVPESKAPDQDASESDFDFDVEPSDSKEEKPTEPQQAEHVSDTTPQGPADTSDADDAAEAEVTAPAASTEDVIQNVGLSFASRRGARDVATDDDGAGSVLPPARLAVLPGATKDAAPMLGAAIRTPGVTVANAPDLPAPRIEPIAEPGPEPEAEAEPAAPAPPDDPIPDPLVASASLGLVDGPAQAESEEQAFTIFGARRRAQQRGKPAYLGLILMLVLLAFLALVAIWSSLMLENGLSGLLRGGEPSVAQAPVTEGADALADAEPEPEEETIAEAPPIVEISPEVAQATYDETGIWLRAPTQPNLPPTPGLDELYVASLDPPNVSHDAVALPAFDASPNDGKLPEQVNPAPPGTTYALDERGFVIPTVEGAINADGVIVYAGRPAKVTPPRPRSAVLPGAETDPAITARLATFRPRARPSDLQERFERGLYGGLTLAELAALRPAPRPEAPQMSASIDATPTEFAVAQSVIPRHRPDDFAATIAAAQAAAAASRDSGSSDDSGGSTATAAASGSAQGRAPSIPTRASVARQATVQNAINLRQISLIGVYGTSSQRRALLRLRNGRYVKVEVGDRVDGGRVAAISDSALQYVKGGRNVTLRMPDL